MRASVERLSRAAARRETLRDFILSIIMLAIIYCFVYLALVASGAEY